MAWSRTLGDLVTDVTDRADVSGFTSRHPTLTIRRRVLESYHALRGWMIDSGSMRWMYPFPVQLDRTQAVQGDYGTHYPLVNAGAASFCKCRKVEVSIGGKWVELPCGVLGDVYDYTASPVGEPRMWIPTGFNNAEPTSTTGAIESIFIVPAIVPTSWVVRVWAHPIMVVVDDDASRLVLDGPGFEWLIWDCVVKIAARDNDSQNTYTIAVREREKCEEQIRRNIATEVQATGQRRDVFDAPDIRRRRAIW